MGGRRTRKFHKESLHPTLPVLIQVLQPTARGGTYGLGREPGTRFEGLYPLGLGVGQRSREDNRRSRKV